MKNTRNLKNYSVIALGLAFLSLINIIFELFFGELNKELINASIPEGSPENIVLITKVFILVVSLFIILPQIYIGFKGIKIAKNPNRSIGHIVWGVIVLIFTSGALITPFLSLIKGEGNALANASELLSIGVDVFVLAEFVKYAIAVRKES